MMSSGFFDLIYLIIKQAFPSKLGAYRRPNAWAVVTGCTDGLGREFALELGRRGFNLVLLSRTPSKLKELAGESALDKVQVLTQAIDFLHPDYDAVSRVLAQAATQGPITVLSNNVGMTHAFPEHLLETSDEVMSAIVTLNIDSVNRMTRQVLPYMVDQYPSLLPPPSIN